jgi:hypothetical protein
VRPAIALIALSVGIFASACGDDGPVTLLQVEERVPRPPSEADSFVFDRVVRIDESTEIDAVRFAIASPAGSRFTAFRRISVTGSALTPSGSLSFEIVDLDSNSLTGSDASAASDLGVVVDQFSADLDADSLPNGDDNCPQVVNATQADTDGDGAGDACDDAPADPDAGWGDRSGYPLVTVTWRIFASPLSIPEEGVQLVTVFEGAGTMDAAD